MDEKFLLRNVFDKNAVELITNRIYTVFPGFAKEQFQNEIFDELERLDFGARCKLIAESLRKYLPENFPDAVNILITALPPELPDSDLKGFNGFIIMPQCDFVAYNGVDYPEISLNALYEMTKRFTAEGQIRVFIKNHYTMTMKFLHKLTSDKSPYARRLATEGTRPRLPLGSRLDVFIKDPSPVIEILEKLKNDPSEMVRRSVANNFNDISKDNPDIVTATLKKWLAEDNSKQMQKLVKHSLRTLEKQGNPQALEILGFNPVREIEVNNFVIKTPEIKTGDYLEFCFDVKNKGNEEVNLLIDYLLFYVKASGKLSPKVFKLTKKVLKAGEVIKVNKRHSFKPIGIRPFYSGVHKIEVQINGKIFEGNQFLLL